MLTINKGEKSPHDGYIISIPEKEFLEIGKEFVAEYLQARRNVVEKYLEKEHCEGDCDKCQ